MARVAFVLMMVFGTVGMLWIIGELVSDPGGAAGVSISVALVLVLVVLVLVAVRSPRWAPTVLGIGVALLLALAAVEAVHRVLPRSSGPDVAIAAFVLAVPLAFLGLRAPRLGGWLLVAAGLAPMVDIVAGGVREGRGGGLHLGGSSGAVAVPLIIGGVLFLLAAVSGGAADRQRED